MRLVRRDPRLFMGLVLLVAACGGGAGSLAPTTMPTGTSASASGSPAGGCAAAPAPPANQPGWTTAPKAPSVFPTIVNSARSLTCGDNRLLFTFLDPDNRPVGAPDRSATLKLFDLGRDGGTPTQSADGRFVWGIENERGFYIANVTFAEAGIWGAEFTTSVAGGDPEVIRMTFEVATSSPVVRVGQRAPASETPTAATAGGDLARITTDPNPDPAFYRVSVKGAIEAHRPFVLIFATPKFCTSAQCGPTLDRVKPLAADFPTVAFIDVEPYLLTYQNGSLQPVLDASGNLQIVPAVADWGLLSEPWVFVVDKDGIVTASFEGVVSTDEIRAAAEAVK
ncbi:MAG: hypothetical protein EPO00_07445 [Chloroflexota bacterium]|nr:MAG: hypothetical protein EPO00_07445 [Chloroflexota bacterium]